jgi:hypothetical protein
MIIVIANMGKKDLLQSFHIVPTSEKPGASTVDILSLPLYRFYHSEKNLSSSKPALIIPNSQDQFCVICQCKYQDEQVLCKLW